MAKPRMNGLIEISRLRVLLDYDSETGKFSWRERRGPSMPGSEPGDINPNGYRYITVEYVAYLAHRLAWFYVYGRWPKQEIDHINRIRDDNRISNLREASVSENRMNRTPTKNQTGFRGVTFSKDKKKYMARVKINGKEKYLGYFDDPKVAYEVAQKARVALFGDFAAHQ